MAGAHWRLKLRLQTALLLCFCGGYFALQRIALFPERTFELSRVDLMIAFDPAWVWVYQSAYVLMGIVPWLADERDDLRRYARGFVLLSAAGFACFLFWPVAGPRPAELPRDAMYRFLVSYDGATNAFPSLHVGLTVYTLLFGVRASEGRLPAGLRAALIGLGIAWSAAIAYATLATKQHFAVDVPAGALLAWLCHHWTWSRVTVRPRRIVHAHIASDRIGMHWHPVSDRRSAVDRRAGAFPRSDGN